MPNENESHWEDVSRLLAKGCYEVANEEAGAVASGRISFTLFPPEGVSTFLQSKEGGRLSESTHSLKHGHKSCEWQLNTSVFANLSVLDSTQDCSILHIKIVWSVLALTYDAISVNKFCIRKIK